MIKLLLFTLVAIILFIIIFLSCAVALMLKQHQEITDIINNETDKELK